jgi:hypothetical protein
MPTTAVVAQNLGGTVPSSTGPFSKWAAVVAATDNHAHSGAQSNAFDNARRDVSAGLVAAGFLAENVQQFSVQPDASDPTSPRLTDADGIRLSMHRHLGEAGDGCLFYFTSHGDKYGIVFNHDKFSPDQLKDLIERTCGGRPTVVFVSACYSGVFVPALAAPNRMVMSAARSDRSSFGCGESDQYPFFDACMIEELPRAPNFPELSSQVKSCIAAKETAQQFKPPSEPQISIGPQIYNLLIQSRFKGH